MQTHNLIQGTKEWLAHRACFWNASDAPAMMGVSPYKSRSALLKELATGLSDDVTPDKQRLFDAGHRFEALARPLAEEIIGEELYPIVGSEGDLSASFDGLTLMYDVAFEHKTLNDNLRAAIRQQGGNANDFLAPAYLVQLEQQCMVSGAQRALFMASKWDGDKLVEERHCWYTPDMGLRAQIAAGWAQFEKDVAAYTPTEAAEPAKADAMDHLPAVSVRLDGALSVAGNLPMFAEALKAFIARMPVKPATDNEFATCDAACKALKKAEEALDAAEAGALASITDVEAMRRAVAECRKLARDTRLASEKLVERRKVEIKEQAVVSARRALEGHVAALNDELAPMRLLPVAADFAAAIKGLRSIASMQDALDTTLANGKIAADAQARSIRANLAAFKEGAAGFEFLFFDLGQVVHKAADDFAALVSARVANHKAVEEKRQEQERERIRAEEVARLAHEAEAKAAGERAAAEAAERQRHADAAKITQDAQESGSVPVTPGLYASSRTESAQVLPSGDEGAAAHAEQRAAEPAIPRVVLGAAISVAKGMLDAAPSIAYTLKLGDIQAMLAPVSITAEGLAVLGIPAHVERGLKLYKRADLSKIREAIRAHVAERLSSGAAVAA